MKKKQSSLIRLFLLAVAFVLSFSSPLYSYAYDDYYRYTYVDSNYHYDPYGNLERHYWDDPDYDEEEYDEVTKMATIGSDGECIEHCFLCGGSRTINYTWSRDVPLSDYNKSYNVTDHSTVYRTSKSITVWLDNAKKGSIVKVKIGKKTYKKKVGTKTKIKINIKNPTYGSKVSIKVYYKGDLIGKTYWWDDDEDDYELEEDEIVYYAKNIKTGMTKKQVRCTYYWGGPSDTASASGGWSYWNYDDGSYIGFKNGRVKYWYDAAG